MADKLEMIGNSGLDFTSGFVSAAYNQQLYWPGVSPLYDRLWRSDPELTAVRSVFSSLAGRLRAHWELPDMDIDPTDDDKRAEEFLESVADDLSGNLNGWYAQCMSMVPFYGWAWWEVVPGVRRKGWNAPDGSGWESRYDDGLIGIQSLGFRYHSSFLMWEQDKRGRMTGFVQQSLNAPYTATIPLSKSLHIVYGDHSNPEGLATMEALWRLERIKYGLEIVQGIGYEHAAGHLSVKVTDAQPNQSAIARAARAVLTAQEGNYAVWPSGVDAEVKDINFSAGSSILEAIRYYGILKLSLFGMQWMAMSGVSDNGSRAALEDASSVAMLMYNSMAEDFTRQAGEQLAKQLLRYNAASFPNLTRRPALKLEPVDKAVSLGELGAFLQAVQAILPLTDEDKAAIRRKSGFLPEIESEDSEDAPETPETQDTPEAADVEELPEPEAAAMSVRRTFTPAPGEAPITTEQDAYITPDELKRIMGKFRKWAEKEEPELSQILNAKAEPEEGGAA